ncbi:MAG: hypothetical protein H7A33_06625 [Deltaproteobacteria bacterium]|nr:hypothetical protein [Deltaproteobacteria bacterium]
MKAIQVSTTNLAASATVVGDGFLSPEALVNFKVDHELECRDSNPKSPRVDAWNQGRYPVPPSRFWLPPHLMQSPEFFEEAFLPRSNFIAHYAPQIKKVTRSDALPWSTLSSLTSDVTLNFLGAKHYLDDFEFGGKSLLLMGILGGGFGFTLSLMENEVICFLQSVFSISILGLEATNFPRSFSQRIQKLKTDTDVFSRLFHSIPSLAVMFASLFVFEDVLSGHEIPWPLSLVTFCFLFAGKRVVDQQSAFHSSKDDLATLESDLEQMDYERWFSNHPISRDDYRRELKFALKDTDMAIARLSWQAYNSDVVAEFETRLKALKTNYDRLDSKAKTLDDQVFAAQVKSTGKELGSLRRAIYELILKQACLSDSEKESLYKETREMIPGNHKG